jgi:hypothetical protein
LLRDRHAHVISDGPFLFKLFNTRNFFFLKKKRKRKRKKKIKGGGLRPLWSSLTKFVQN